MTTEALGLLLLLLLFLSSLPLFSRTSPPQLSNRIKLASQSQLPVALYLFKNGEFIKTRRGQLSISHIVFFLNSRRRRGTCGQ